MPDQIETESAFVWRERGVGAHILRLLTGEGVNRALRFVALALFARALSGPAFGQLSIGVAAASIVFTVTSLGLSEAGTRTLALERAHAGWHAGQILSVRLVAIVVTGLPTLALLSAISAPAAATLGLAWVMALLMTLGGDWILRALHRTASAALALAAGGTTVLAGALLLYHRSPTAVEALAIFAGGEAATAMVAWALVVGRIKPRFGLRGASSTVREALPLAMSVIVTYAFFSSLDTILVGVLRSEREAGLYSAPYRIFTLITLVSTYAAYVLLPVATRAVQQFDIRPTEALGPMPRALAAYALAALAAIEVAGSRMLTALFGAPFADAAPAFVLLAAAAAWYCFAYPLGYANIGAGDYRGFLAGSAAGAVVMVGFDLVAIPLAGITGAGAGTLAGVVVASLTWLSRTPGELRRRSDVLLALTFASCLAVLVAANSVSHDLAGIVTLGASALLAVGAFLEARRTQGSSSASLPPWRRA